LLNFGSRKPTECFISPAEIFLQRLRFDHVTSLWDVYSDVPKFAVVNEMRAPIGAMMGSASTSIDYETYDTYLSDFLTTVLNKSDINDTFIVLQSRPRPNSQQSRVEYSTQIEERRPWTLIIAPQKYAGIDNLVSNQDKLVTSLDLYYTIRSLIEPTKRTEKSLNRNEEKVPSWAFDLLETPIPEGRNCAEARVLPVHCPCNFQSMDAPRV